MKIFDKFIRSDKRNEFVILYIDTEMTQEKGTMVFDLKDVKEGRVRFADIEDQLADFNESSYRQIRDAFELLRDKPKELNLRYLGGR